MAWVTPRTWTIGQLVSADDLNEQIRDNLNHLKLAVGNDGKIPDISSTYFANLSGANLTNVVKTAVNNDFTAGNHKFNAGAGTRLIWPTGVDKWAA